MYYFLQYKIYLLFNHFIATTTNLFLHPRLTDREYLEALCNPVSVFTIKKKTKNKRLNSTCPQPFPSSEYIARCNPSGVHPVSVQLDECRSDQFRHQITLTKLCRAPLLSVMRSKSMFTQDSLQDVVVKEVY